MYALLLELHILTLAARSCVLLMSHIQKTQNFTTKSTCY